MKYYFLLFLGLLLTTSVLAQDVAISYESIDNTVYVYGSNPHPCPVSVQLTLKLTNMTADSQPPDRTYVLPASTSKSLLTTLEPKDIRRSSQYHIDYFAKYGDVTLTSYDSEHVYQLPYKAGKTVAMHQGYNGKRSHRGVNALDFALDKGEQIHAARGGVVIDVEERNSKGCSQPSCHKYNNTIVIYHSDGTLAVYSHLQQYGSRVDPGDTVVAGQHIGYAGATGYATGPHLHFMVLQSTFDGNTTIKTTFDTKEGSPIYLQEHQKYTRP